jgi:hypothetical protein
MATTTKRAALSPERQALAVAIEALRVADAEIAELQENDAVRTEHSYTCLEAIDVAESALRDTTRRMEQAFALAERTQWEAPPAPPLAIVEAVPAARRRYDEALAERDAVRAELRIAEANRERLAARVERAALAVVAKHAADTGLVAEIDRLHREAFDKGLRLAWLNHHGMIDTSRLGHELPPVSYTLHRVRATLNWAKEMPPDLPGAAPYAKAIAALMTDATEEIGDR